MKDLIRYVLNVMCFSGAAAIAVLFVVFNVTWRLENIDMTETRLFITYWKELALMLALYSLFAIGERLTK